MDKNRKWRNFFVADSAIIGEGVELGQNTIIEENVVIGKNTYIDCNCVIREGTIIGEDSFVGSNCIIGEYQNDFIYTRKKDNYKLSIGKNALIRSGSIIYSNSTIGDDFQTGHQVTIREESIIGNSVSVGTLSDIQGTCEIGNYVRLHSNVHIGQLSSISDYVWIFPYVVLTNDPTPPSEICVGPTVGDYSIVATHCLLLPGVKIGQHCLIGACSMVSKDVADYTVAVGSPAKVVKDIREVKDRESGESHYPWPYHFDRNMPWKGVDYEEWLKENMK